MHTKYSENDITLIAMTEISIPIESQELKHHVKNIAGVVGRCFDQVSLIYYDLNDIAEHIEKRGNKS